MLNFENMRKLTGHMLSESRAYTEGFVQKILDNIFFDKEQLSEDSVHFSCSFKSEDLDPLGIFETVEFWVEFDCYGKICFEFREESAVDIPAFRLLSECLLNNGFVRTDNLQFTHPGIGHS